MDFVLVIMIFYSATAAIDHIEFSTLKQCEDAKIVLTEQIREKAPFGRSNLTCFRRAPAI